jgi:hypothetical protein
MKNWMKILAALVIVGLAAAFAVYKYVYNKPHTDFEKAETDYEFSADDLWAAYTYDFAKSDTLYNGKVLVVKGELSRVDKTDSLTYAVFVMEPDSMFGDKSIRFEMLSKYNEKISATAPGTVLKIKGFCNGYDQVDVKLSSCSIPE